MPSHHPARSQLKDGILHFQIRRETFLRLLGPGLLSFAVLASLAHYWYHTRSQGRSSIFELGNDFGPLITNLTNSGTYQVCNVLAERGWGDICFHAHRLPFVPLLLSALAQISDSLLFAFIVKNAIMYLANIATIHIIVKKVAAIKLAHLMPLLVLFLVPYNLFTATSLEFEEGYIIHLMPLAFIVIVLMERPRHVAVAGGCVALLAFTKSSLFYACVVLAACAAWFAFVRFRSLPLSLVVPAFTVAAFLGWGAFSYAETGHWAFANTMSSFNGWNLYKSLHPGLFEYYPALSPDYLDIHGLTRADGRFVDEWSLNRHYADLAKQRLLDEPGAVTSGIARKAYVALVSVMEVGQPTRQDYRLSLSTLINRIVGYGLLAWIALACVRNRHFWRRYGPEIGAFLAVSASYMAPFIIGFNYNRHMLPLAALVYLWSFSLLVRENARDRNTESGFM